MLRATEYHPIQQSSTCHPLVFIGVTFRNSTLWADQWRWATSNSSSWCVRGIQGPPPFYSSWAINPHATSQLPTEQVDIPAMATAGSRQCYEAERRGQHRQGQRRRHHHSTSPSLQSGDHNRMSITTTLQRKSYLMAKVQFYHGNPFSLHLIFSLNFLRYKSYRRRHVVDLLRKATVAWQTFGNAVQLLLMPTSLGHVLRTLLTSYYHTIV
jgi:hypothetical protein